MGGLKKIILLDWPPEAQKCMLFERNQKGMSSVLGTTTRVKKWWEVFPSTF